MKKYIRKLLGISEDIENMKKMIKSNRDFLERLVTQENRMNDEIYQKIVRVVGDYFPLEIREAGGGRKVIAEASGKRWKELMESLKNK